MHTRVGNLILFLLFPLPQFLLFLLTCCFSWQLHRSSTTGCFNSVSSNSCFCLFLYNPRGLLRSLCNSGAWSSDPTPFMVSQVPKTHSCVGFLCTSAAIGLFDSGGCARLLVPTLQHKNRMGTVSVFRLDSNLWSNSLGLRAIPSFWLWKSSLLRLYGSQAACQQIE